MTCTMLVLLALCFIVCCDGVPSEAPILSAIERAKGLNKQNTSTDAGAPAVNSCPHMLGNFHGIRSSNDKLADKKSTDLLKAAHLLMKQGFTLDDLRHENVRRIFHEKNEHCPSIPKCHPTSQYRSADGSCNNLNKPQWGQSGQAQTRIVNSAYDDGLSTPRKKSVFGSDLPNPRLVSNIVHAAPVGPEVRSNYITLHTFQMGQFLDHDLVATPAQSSVKDCCADTVKDDSGYCMPIICDGDDQRFSTGYCMSFRRSSPIFCPLDSPQREQINGITSFVDASNVYGSSDAAMLALRDNGGTGAFLKIVPVDRLPINPDNTVCRSDVANGVFCSLAGDHRVDVVPSLTTYHTLFVREHNRIAAALRPFYSNDETLFQETRKIVMGVMQKVVYDEFLPAIMSPAAMEKYKLSSANTYVYDEQLNPTVSNGFGMAFRMGHSWIPRNMDMYTRNLQLLMNRNTAEHYFNPAMTYENHTDQSDSVPGMEGLAYGLSAVNSPDNDRFVEDAARNRLFEDSDGNAFDLVSLNIQRGRDHGLPSFSVYRSFCGLSELPQEWSSKKSGGLVDIPQEIIDLLAQVYQSPQDIDLFTGILAETPVSGGVMGPTLDCLLGDQFMKLKYGDRFWYQGQANGFSEEQQAEIQRASMARILCDNFNFDKVHSNAFVPSNLVSCNDVESMDLTKFKPTDGPGASDSHSSNNGNANGGGPGVGQGGGQGYGRR